MRQPDEKVQKYILQVQAQAAKCHFGESLDSALRDRLISRSSNRPPTKTALIVKIANKTHHYLEKTPENTSYNICNM